MEIKKVLILSCVILIFAFVTKNFNDIGGGYERNEIIITSENRIGKVLSADAQTLYTEMSKYRKNFEINTVEQMIMVYYDNEGNFQSMKVKNK